MPNAYDVLLIINSSGNDIFLSASCGYPSNGGHIDKIDQPASPETLTNHRPYSDRRNTVKYTNIYRKFHQIGIPRYSLVHILYLIIIFRFNSLEPGHYHGYRSTCDVTLNNIQKLIGTKAQQSTNSTKTLGAVLSNYFQHGQFAVHFWHSVL